MKVFKEIWIEMILIAIFAIVICFYNEKVSMLVSLCFMLSIMSFIIKDGKLKLVSMFVIVVALIFAGVIYIKINEKGQEALQIILKEYVWLVWFNCIMINNMLVSKLCIGRKLIDKISCVLGYIVALILGLYFSFLICAQSKVTNIQDMSLEINIITAIFVLVYAFLQVFICTKDELWLFLFWEYELDHEGDRVRLLRCRINKRKYIIKSDYIIGNKKMKTYLLLGAFENNKKVEEVNFLHGVEIKKQTIFQLFRYNKNLKKVEGLTKSISCDYRDRKNLPNLKSVQWINLVPNNKNE